jgi:phenylalanine-4-hydroxylase
MQTDYRIDDFQETYFVINSLNDLLSLAKIDFAPLYEQMGSKPDIAPGQLQAQDVLFNRGTGSYHKTAP